MPKFDPFLSLDCARVEGVGARSKERKVSNFAAQRSGAIVQKPEGPKTNDLKIWLSPSGNHALSPYPMWTSFKFRPFSSDSRSEMSVFRTSESLQLAIEDEDILALFEDLKQFCSKLCLSRFVPLL